jgi:hypothetical protein
MVRVPASDLGEWKQLCDMHGVDEKTMETFGEKIYHGTANGEGLTGHDKGDGDNHGGDADGHAKDAEVVHPHSREWAKTSVDKIKSWSQGQGPHYVNGVNGAAHGL